MEEVWPHRRCCFDAHIPYTNWRFNTCREFGKPQRKNNRLYVYQCVRMVGDIQRCDLLFWQ